MVLELKQDLADNTKLDCLRTIKPRHGEKETTSMTNARLAAQWDTDCAFEADYDWKKRTIALFGINTLSDANGEP